VSALINDKKKNRVNYERSRGEPRGIKANDAGQSSLVAYRLRPASRRANVIPHDFITYLGIVAVGRCFFVDE